MLAELTVIEQRYLAVREVLDTGARITDVAMRYGVDRRTLHRWLTRYAKEGMGALADRSHRPDTCPHQMPAVLWHRGRISGVDLAYCRAAVCVLLGPDIADRLADAYSGIVGGTPDELAVYDLMYVFSSRHHLAESLAADREQGHVPNYQVSLAHLDEHVRRSLKRLDQ